MNCGVVNRRRMAQARELQDVAAAAAGQPTVLCMDSNSDGEQPEMRWLRETGGWQDAWLTVGDGRRSGATWSSQNRLTQQGHLTGARPPLQAAATPLQPFSRLGHPPIPRHQPLRVGGLLLTACAMACRARPALRFRAVAGCAIFLGQRLNQADGSVVVPGTDCRANNQRSLRRARGASS